MANEVMMNQKENQKVEVVVEKKNVLQKINDKRKGFEEKHPVASKRIKTAGKVVAVAGAIAGAFAVGKAIGGKDEDEGIEVPSFEVESSVEDIPMDLNEPEDTTFDEAESEFPVDEI